MSNGRKRVIFLIKGLVTSILVLGIGYTIYTNFIGDKEVAAINKK